MSSRATCPPLHSSPARHAPASAHPRKACRLQPPQTGSNLVPCRQPPPCLTHACSSPTRPCPRYGDIHAYTVAEAVFCIILININIFTGELPADGLALMRAKGS
jgi:hypothetical protein